MARIRIQKALLTRTLQLLTLFRNRQMKTVTIRLAIVLIWLAIARMMEQKIQLRLDRIQLRSVHRMKTRQQIVRQRLLQAEIQHSIMIRRRASAGLLQAT